MTINYDSDSTKLNVGLISIHPAPYRDAVLTSIYKRENLKIQVLTMFKKDIGHTYWNIEKEEYPNIYLGKSFKFRGRHFHFKLLTSIHKRKFHVIVIPGYFHPTSLIAIIYCILIRKPFIYTADSITRIADSKHKNLIRDSIVGFILNHAAAFWIPGNASKQFLISKGVEPDRIYEGCYCLDANKIITQVLKERTNRDSLRKQLGIRPDDFVYLMVGNMIPSREHTLLIEMFKQVESNNEKVFLILLGEGSEVEAVKAAIKKHACQNVRIVAPVSYDNLPKWYAASNAYIHSGSEPYSTAVEFAAKAALPIITTELVGASFDYVHHNKSGYLVKYGNNDDFTNKMLYLSLNPKLALKMGQNALNIAQKRTSEWSAEQFEDAVKYVNNSLIKYVCDK